ncbi:MAG: YidC/Oxa1 family membrane protein insertase, partial [Clostridiales bacterium]|nr:YidC/Oxa1 family membrane protein insertase [Clostridiales bacterium]
MSSIFDMINIPLGYLIRFFYSFTHNYAIALLLFAIVIKVILLPLGIKQQKNQVKQAQLRPKEMAIRQKYAGREDQVTKQKMQQEIMDLYQKEHFSPMGGCLPLLIELPIIWCLFTVITHPLRYLCQFDNGIIANIVEKIASLQGIETAAAERMSQINQVSFIRDNFASFSEVLPTNFTIDQLPNFMMGPFDLGATPKISEPSWLWAIPVITFIIVFISTKVMRLFTYKAPGTEDQMKSLQLMDITMPLFSVYITFTVPAVVGLYWIYQNLLSALRQFVLYKLYPIPTFTEEEIRQAQKEYNGKVTKNKAAAEKPRSLHHIDDDDFPDELRKNPKNKPAQSLPKAEPEDGDDDGDSGGK